MKPQEKAKELINEFYPHVQWKLGQENCLERAKKCALISVDEIMQVLSIIPYGMQYLSEIDYWEEVKLEIKKL